MRLKPSSDGSALVGAFSKPEVKAEEMNILRTPPQVGSAAVSGALRYPRLSFFDCSHLSIASLLVISVLVFSTLTLGTLGLVFWYNEKAVRRADFDHTAAHSADQIATALSHPVWNFDEAQVVRLVDGAFTDADLTALRLIRPNMPDLSRSRGEKGSTPLDFAPIMEGGLFIERRELSNSGRRLGMVELYFSPAALERSDRESFYYLATIIGSFILLLVAGTYWMLWRLVIQPLRKLDEFSESVSAGGVPPHLGRDGFRGELLSLRGSMERTMNLLRLRLSELERSEGKLQSIFNGTSDAILVRRAVGERASDFPIVEVNDVACRILSLHRETLVGSTFGEVLEGTSRGDPGLAYGTGLSSIRYTRPDGGEVALEVLNQAVPMEDGIYVITTARDVTAREKSDKERGELEEQLRQAHKMEAVGRLAGGVAHDFNNILTAILGYCELADRMKDITPKARAYVGNIKTVAENATLLTQQLLAFSRKQHLQPRAIPVSDAIEAVRKMMGRMLGENIRLVIDIGAGVGCVWADPGQLSQVLMNLTINARDAMPNGGTLTVRATAVEVSVGSGPRDLAPGGYVHLVISDTGVGMSEETKAKIFEPFFTTKEKGKGTGLGLATVHGIVSQSGGAIEVESRPGKGAAFNIWFPRFTGQVEAETAQRETAETRGGDETLLLVEDSDDVRIIASGLLSGLGYTVLEAASGEEAQKLSEDYEGEIDLLVTDLIMPGINGMELARSLTPRRPGMKVLFMSGYTEESIASHGIRIEGVPFLHKPFGSGELTSKIRQALTTETRQGWRH